MRKLWIGCLCVLALSVCIAWGAMPLGWAITIATPDDATELAGARAVSVDFEAGEIVVELYDGRTLVTSLERGDVITLSGVQE